uniref:Uncharacterized protein n=1 Tax=Rhizophora mucronata TaxID=61149 RepID=A0A2P2LX24_RHIMU
MQDNGRLKKWRWGSVKQNITVHKHTTVNVVASLRLQQLMGGFNSNQPSNAFELLLNHTYPLVPKCPQENPPFPVKN